MAICRFCGDEWSPPPGVYDYCSGCREERRRIAKEHFDNDGKVAVIRGKHVIRIPKELLKEDDELFHKD